MLDDVQTWHKSTSHAFSAHLPCEAEQSTLQKPVPLGVTHADSEMLSTLLVDKLVC